MLLLKLQSTLSKITSAYFPFSAGLSIAKILERKLRKKDPGNMIKSKNTFETKLFDQLPGGVLKKAALKISEKYF